VDLLSRSSLESPTKLDRACVPSREGRWLLKLYPDAGEAGGCFESAAARSATGSWFEPEPDLGRSADEAARRARGQVRRYCAANRLNRLGTLTYAPPFCRDPRAVRDHVGSFIRALRRRTERMAYLWVPELHADGERYHVHFAVGRFVHREWIDEAWGHGFVHIKLLGDLPVGSGALEEARLAARYLSKYVGKALERGPAGLHRYEVAQGFQPKARRLVGSSVPDVIAQAVAIMGGEPDLVWDSDNDPAWARSHAVWASWAR
jgi:hypothetical protein